MQFTDLIAQTIRSTRSRPLESGLIVIAVALGVSVVTVMLALLLNSAAFNSSFERSLEGRMVQVVGKNGDARAFDDGVVIRDGVGEAKKVTLAMPELEMLRTESPAVKYAYLMDGTYTNRPNLPGMDLSNWSQINFRAVTPEFIPAAGLQLIAGSWPNAEDFKAHRSVVVVSDVFAHRWYAKQDILGQKIVGQEATYTVIGVFVTPSTTSEFQSADVTISNMVGIAPWKSGNPELYSIANSLFFVPKPGLETQAREQLQTAATKYFADGVRVHSSASKLEQQRQLALGTALMTAVFACGGLLIAAMNITNLMLARVLQRTRRIGIARALGASQRTVFVEFLLEASVLGGAGALIGLGFALGLVSGLNALIRDSIQLPGFRLELQAAHLVFGFALGVGVNLLFGAYPAWLASRTQVSVALRST
jgi:putative ABC transport system permease protein